METLRTAIPTVQVYFVALYCVHAMLLTRMCNLFNGQAIGKFIRYLYYYTIEYTQSQFSQK